MKKVLLTSAGFENEKIREEFLKLVDKNPQDIKAVFIPTAAIDSEAIAVLPKCMNDLLNSGIKSENIYVYDLHREMSASDLKKYDVIYVCGGDPYYLIKRVNEANFNNAFLESDAVYVGVSAGSWIATNNVKNSLGFFDGTIDVHEPIGSSVGLINMKKSPHIKLTNNQAILIHNDKYSVIE